MTRLIFSQITNEDELEILDEQRWQRDNLNFNFDKNTLDLLRKNLKRKNSLYLLAKQNNNFVSFISTDNDWWESDYFFIREILVNQNLWSQGIGTKMMQKCIDHARKNGAIGIVTETDFKNLPMQKLCQKFGFQEWDNPQWKEGITFKLLFS